MATNESQILIGDEQDNLLVGGARDDELYGAGGDDQLTAGGGDDLLDGGAGDDDLIAGGGDDTLDGGVDDDSLNGGGGSDTFVFDFAVEEGAGVNLNYEAWAGLPESGWTAAQNDFVHSYNTWLNTVVVPEIEKMYGLGEDSGLVLEWGNGSVGVKGTGNPLSAEQTTEMLSMFNGLESFTQVAGRNTLTKNFLDNFTGASADQITSSDGNDTIVQFHQNDSLQDTIQLNGITLEQALALFSYEETDANGDGTMDTVISWEGATDAADGSITVLDFDAADGLQDFLTSYTSLGAGA